jgi:glucokinase
MADYAIGIDLGGTKIAGALINRQGHVLEQVKRPTLPQEGVDAVVDRIVACIRELEAVTHGSVAGIGLGAPAAVDSQRQIVTSAVNLGWYDVPLGALLIERLGTSWANSLWLDKDVSAATLCEALYGAGQGARYLIYVGVGTGVGAGQMLNGRLYCGAHGSDGNIGHFILDPGGEVCGCGKRGCVETLSSGPSIARRAVAALSHHESSSLAMLDSRTITAIEVVEAAKAGDQLARRILAEAGRYLGIALAFYIDMINPERVIIGGGMIAAGDLLLDPLRQAIREWALPVNVEPLRVVPAAVQNAGAIGAAAFVWYFNLG